MLLFFVIDKNSDNFSNGVLRFYKIRESPLPKGYNWVLPVCGYLIWIISVKEEMPFSLNASIAR